MKNSKDNEMKLVLLILKSPEKEYNSRNLAELMGISPMGALKIARRLAKEGILKAKQIGKSKIYSINHESSYAISYASFLMKRESEWSKAYVKRWIGELQKIKHANAIILFGSVLKKEKEAEDIDSLIIVNKKAFQTVEKEVDKINILNEKKIHPVYQTEEDLEKNIKSGNKVILNAIKGIVVSGEEKLVSLLRK